MKNDLFSIGNFTIHGYGLMIALGFLLCVLMGMYRAKKLKLSSEAVLDIALIGLVAGFVGAKLLYVIVEFPTFLEDPLRVIGSEGFVVYGGIAAGVAAGLVYCRVKKLVFWDYFDLAAPSIALAQGVGRIGCFLAGCCYGRETDSWCGVVFPEGSLAPAGIKLIPTQLISSAGDLLIVAILLLYHKRAKHRGDVGALYMLLYGVGRFVIEIFRWDDRGTVGALSTSQAISIVIVIGGILLFLTGRKRVKAEEPAAERKAAETEAAEEPVAERKTAEETDTGKNGEESK